MWLASVTDGASVEAIAAAAGVSTRTVMRWGMRGVDPTSVIRIARAFKADPVNGLIASGWLMRSDMSADMFRRVAKRIPAVVLMDEIRDRYENGTLLGE